MKPTLYLDNVPETQQMLRKLRFNLDYVKQIIGDDRKGEVELVRKFTDCKDYDPTPYHSGSISCFQQSAIDTNYVYAVCPVSGVALRTNVLFLVHARRWPYVFYFFSAETDFYLIAGGGSGAKCFMYIPSSNISIAKNSLYPSSRPERIRKLVKNFVALSKQYSDQAAIHKSSPGTRTMAVLTNYSSHIFRAFTADYAGLFDLVQNNFLDDSVRLLSLGLDYFPFTRHIRPLYVEKCHAVDPATLFAYSISRKYFILQPSAGMLSSAFCNFLVAGSRSYLNEHGNPSNIDDMALVSGCSRIKLLIILRTDRRVWAEQEQGISFCISRMRERFVDLVIVFDGYSSTASGNTSNSGRSNEGEIIRSQEKLASTISEAAGLSRYVSVIGKSFDVKIALASYCNLYLTGYGAGITLPYILGIPGVIHCSALHASNNKIESEAQQSRENAAIPCVVSSTEKPAASTNELSITSNQELATTPYFNEDYSINPDIVSAALMSLATVLIEDAI